MPYDPTISDPINDRRVFEDERHDEGEAQCDCGSTDDLVTLGPGWWRCASCRNDPGNGWGVEMTPVEPPPASTGLVACPFDAQGCAGPDRPWPCGRCEDIARHVPTAPEGVPVTMAQLVAGGAR